MHGKTISPMGKRMIGIFCAICLLFTGLYLRIAAIMSDDSYAQAAVKQSSYTLKLPASRGMIYDSGFSPLVNQTVKYQAAVLPSESNIQAIMNAAVGISKDDLTELFRQGKPFFCEVNTDNMNLEGVEIFKVPQRYGTEMIAPHVIGYLDKSTMQGITGIEKAYNSLLNQKEEETQISYALDGLGRPLAGAQPEVKQGAQPENGVVLTLDQQIQKICQRAGEQKIEKGAIVVMECDTGKLRAVCSFPEYSMKTLSKDVIDEENAPMINRAFNPTSVGSTFKVAIAASALMQGYSTHAPYTCTGAYQMGETTFQCHYLPGHGQLEMRSALINSCNPFFIYLGLGIDFKNVLNTANDLSFGKQYELAPGIFTQAGILPAMDDIRDLGEIANLSFGQGNLLATPVQLAQMISCVVNNGVTPVPMLVEGETIDGKSMSTSYEPSIGIQAMDEATAAQLKEYLVACVMEHEGQYAKPQTVSAGGKTGTAQTGVFKNGKELCNGWFVGFFPAENPKYVVAIVTEDSDTGNMSASPVFSMIADQVTALEQE